MLMSQQTNNIHTHRKKKVFTLKPNSFDGNKTLFEAITTINRREKKMREKNVSNITEANTIIIYKSHTTEEY